MRRVQAEHPRQLTIQTESLATRVLLDETNRAIGVDYLRGPHLYRADPGGDTQSSGEARQAFATREVILACGAFNSPQLLKLSGIGRAEELRQHAIDVRVDLPGVGENLQDRYEVGVICEMMDDFDLIKDCSFRVPEPGAPLGHTDSRGAVDSRAGEHPLSEQIVDENWGVAFRTRPTHAYRSAKQVAGFTAADPEEALAASAAFVDGVIDQRFAALKCFTHMCQIGGGGLMAEPVTTLLVSSPTVLRARRRRVFAAHQAAALTITRTLTHACR